MSELTNIAKQLGELYKVRSGAQITKIRLERDIDDRKLEITPHEGWIGKNTEERKTAQERVFADDERICGLVGELDGCVEELAETEGQIQALEAERRAREWDIRLKLVDALTGNNVQQNHRYRTPDNVFDDVLDDRSLGDVNPEFPIPTKDYTHYYQQTVTTADAEIPF